VNDPARREHGVPARAFTGIQVEVDVVGPIHVIAAGVPLIQIDAAQVDDPEERRQIVDDREVDDVARVVADGAGPDPLRTR
jgi:hypothetical protein